MNTGYDQEPADGRLGIITREEEKKSTQASRLSLLHREKESMQGKSFQSSSLGQHKCRHVCLFCTFNLVDLRHSVHPGSHVCVF